MHLHAGTVVQNLMLIPNYFSEPISAKIQPDMANLPTQQFINCTAWYGLILENFRKVSHKLSGLDVGPDACFQVH